MVTHKAATDGPPAAAAASAIARELGAVLVELGLTEIEVTVGDVHVRLQRAAPPTAVAAASSPVPAPAASPSGLTVTEIEPPTSVTIDSPMVGTFYRASSPTAEPFIREGDVVKEGQVVCIIEAMKLMNEIECRAAGRILKILVENGQPVEYGQPLFVLEPPR